MTGDTTHQQNLRMGQKFCFHPLPSTFMFAVPWWMLDPQPSRVAWLVIIPKPSTWIRLIRGRQVGLQMLLAPWFR